MPQPGGPRHFQVEPPPKKKTKKTQNHIHNFSTIRTSLIIDARSLSFGASTPSAVSMLHRSRSRSTAVSKHSRCLLGVSLAPSVHATAHFRADNGMDYLVAASGESGAVLYAWSPGSQNFSRVQRIGVGSQPDSNAVGVVVVELGSERVLVVSNWVRNDGTVNSGTRVYR